MPRSSGRSSSRPSAPAPSRSMSTARAPPPAAAPAPRHAPPPPAAAPAPMAPAPMAPQQSGGMLGGLGRTMAEGFAFGTGSAIARNVVNSVMGGGSSSAPAQAPAAAPAPAIAAPAAPRITPGCELDYKDFTKCMQENPNNAGMCDLYSSAYQSCQQRAM